MTLTTILQQKLTPLAGQTAPRSAPLTIVCPALNGTLEIQLTQVDPLACEALSIGLMRPSPPLDASRLPKIAEQLAQRLHYLLEPIQVVEIDSQEKLVQMRSAPPGGGPRERTFYELLLRTGGIELRRYRARGGQPRMGIPMLLTHEVLCRVAEDLVAACHDQPA